MTRAVRWLAALVCALLMLGALCGCEGEPAGADNEYPVLQDTYAESDFENIRFRCTVSWETASGETREKELPKDVSVEVYNLLDRGAWTAPEDHPPAATKPILTLEFTTGDTIKAKNCYGCVYLSDADQVVFTQSGASGALTPYAAPTGTYDAVWAKVSAALGE
ncbi:MAG: hypothetical protein IKI63_03215 [Clostridia bacterium]|nr:hypothetical protein [Clostridia bacterium]